MNTIDTRTGDQLDDDGSVGQGSYAPGDIVNGWVLGDDLQWHPAPVTALDESRVTQSKDRTQSTTGGGSGTMEPRPAPDSAVAPPWSSGPDAVETLQGSDIAVHLSNEMLIFSGLTQVGRQALEDRDTIALDVVDVVGLEHSLGHLSHNSVTPGWLIIKFSSRNVLRSVAVQYHPYLVGTANSVYSRILQTPRTVETTGPKANSISEQEVSRTSPSSGTANYPNEARPTSVAARSGLGRVASGLLWGVLAFIPLLFLSGAVVSSMVGVLAGPEQTAASIAMWLVPIGTAAMIGHFRYRTVQSREEHGNYATT